MMAAVFYSLGSAVCILYIIFLLRELLGSRGAGGNSPAPFGEPANDLCWWCHHALGADRQLANLPTGQKAFICPTCAASLPGMKHYLEGGSRG